MATNKADQTAAPAAAPGERKDVPLGTLIFRAGLLSEEQLEEALQDAINRGRRLGQVLLERGLLQESDLSRLLAEQRGLEFVSLKDQALDPQARSLLPQEVAWINHALPLRFEGESVVVAIEDPTDEVVMRNVKSVIAQDVHFVVATRSEIQEVLAPAQPAPAPAHEAPASAGPPSPQPPPARDGSGPACRVVLRLRDGDRVDVGEFENEFRAEEEARSIVRRLAVASASDWPLFGNRFVRPEAVVSIDLEQPS